MSDLKIDVPAITEFIQKSSGFDNVLQNLKIVALGDGKCVAELTVEEQYLNYLKSVHGGFSATLIDSVSTFALMASVGQPGLSVDIHVSYLKTAKLGDEILIEANVVKTGKNIAFLEAVIKNKATGDILVKASHTKFLSQDGSRK